MSTLTVDIFWFLKVCQFIRVGTLLESNITNLTTQKIKIYGFKYQTIS